MARTDFTSTSARRAGTAALALLGAAAATAFALPAPSAAGAPLTVVTTVSPTPTATSAPAPSPTSCYALLYQRQWYCSASIAKIRSTSYGTGKRMVLRQVTVTDVRTPGKVTVAAYTAKPCPPGHYCAAILTLESVTLAWKSTLARPAYGDVLDAYGTTTTGSMSVSGTVITGNCPIDWC